MKNIKYVLKLVIIGILIGLGIMFFKNNISFAATIDTMYHDDSTDFTSYWYKSANTSTLFRFYGFGNEPSNENLYLNYLFCTDGTSGSAWSNSNDPQSYTGDGTRNSWQINITNIPCNMKGASWKGHVVQVTGITRTGQDGGGDITVYLRLAFNQNASISLNMFNISPTPVDFISSELDYTNALSNINGILNTIHGSLGNLKTGIETANSIHQQELEKLGEIGQTMIAMEEAMKDADIENDNPQFAEFDDYLANNGVITNLVTMPVTLFTKILNTLNGTCANYNLGNLYGTDLTLPCINISNYLGTPLWSVIDVIISGLLVYAISRHFIKIFNKMSSLEESDIID